MRLIDADNLIQAYFNAINETSIGEVSIIDIIDNAPTVEPYSTYIISGKRFGKREEALKWLRPQGEWNYIQAGMAICPFCGATPHKQYKNFCPNCGAEMKI